MSETEQKYGWFDVEAYVSRSEHDRLRAERDALRALLCRARPYVEQDDSGLTRKGAADFALLADIDAAIGKGQP